MEWYCYCCSGIVFSSKAFYWLGIVWSRKSSYLGKLSVVYIGNEKNDCEE